MVFSNSETRLSSLVWTEASGAFLFLRNLGHVCLSRVVIVEQVGKDCSHFLRQVHRPAFASLTMIYSILASPSASLPPLLSLLLPSSVFSESPSSRMVK